MDEWMDGWIDGWMYGPVLSPYHRLSYIYIRLLINTYDMPQMFTR